MFNFFCKDYANLIKLDYSYSYLTLFNAMDIKGNYSAPNFQCSHRGHTENFAEELWV